MRRKQAPEPVEQDNALAEQVESLSDRVAVLEQQLAELRAVVASSLGISA